MENRIQLFNFEDQQVRTMLIEDKPYFVGKNVSIILGYQNGSRDVNRHVDEEDRIKMMMLLRRISKWMTNNKA